VPHVDGCRTGPGVLGHVSQRLGGDEVGGRLDRGGQPLGRRGHRYGYRRAAREVAQRRPQPGLGQHGWVDAPREPADLVDGGRHLGIRLADERLQGGCVAQPGAGQPQDKPDPEQVLLRAVVQVAFDPPPFGVAGLHDPRPGRAYFAELGLQFGVQPGVFQGQPGGRTDCVEQRRVVQQGGVVHQCRQRCAARLKQGDRALRAAGGQRHLPAVEVGVAVLLGQPEAQLQPGVAQRPGDRVTRLGQGRSAVELHDQVGDHGMVQPGAQQPGQERERHGGPGHRHRDGQGHEDGAAAGQVEHGRGEDPGEKCHDGHRSGPDHRGQCPPARPGGPPPAADLQPGC
jgi:hypothetical protein